MKLELLYPELSNLFGENGNQHLLSEIFGEENVLRTRFPNPPRFLREEVTLVVMGAMTEEKQKLILSVLLPLKEEIHAAVERGQFLFFTGNALDLTGKEIRYDGADVIHALGLFDFVTETNKYDRTNAFVYGETAAGSEVFGWISQFTKYIGDMPHFVQGEKRGYGAKRNNLYATSLLGPLLITSPQFTKELLREMGMEDRLPREEALIAAFERRKAQMLARE